MSVKFYSIESVDRPARKVELPKMCRYCFKRVAAPGCVYCNHPNCNQPRRFRTREDDPKAARTVLVLLLCASFIVFMLSKCS